jgi:hypothetical protein
MVNGGIKVIIAQYVMSITYVQKMWCGVSVMVEEESLEGGYDEGGMVLSGICRNL